MDLWLVAFFVWLGVVSVLVSILFILVFQVAYSQDADPRYYCIEKLHTPYPFSELCKEQVLNDVQRFMGDKDND
jgi:hypothetical protein